MIKRYVYIHMKKSPLRQLFLHIYRPTAVSSPAITAFHYIFYNSFKHEPIQNTGYPKTEKTAPLSESRIVYFFRVTSLYLTEPVLTELRHSQSMHHFHQRNNHPVSPYSYIDVRGNRWILSRRSNTLPGHRHLHRSSSNL